LTFERGFADTERAAVAAEKSVSQLAGAVKQLHKASVEGDIQKIRKVSERLSVILDATRQEVENARTAWPFTAESEEAYLRDSYEAEITAAAAAENVQIQKRDEGLVVFPAIVRILPSEYAVKINKKKVAAVRPTHLARTLKAIQSKKPKARPESFLEVLHRAYRLVTQGEYGSTVKLASLYDALTMLPGAIAIYDQTEFVRDLYLLDRSGATQTRSGAVCSLPASTGTKSSKGTYAFTGPDGQSVTYYGIRFTRADTASDSEEEAS